MTVTENNNDVETVTEFFAGLIHGTYVSSGANVLIYVGNVYDTVANAYVPRVLNPEHFQITDLTASRNTPNREDGWKVVYNDDSDEDPRVADSYSLRIFREFCQRSAKLVETINKLHTEQAKNLDLNDDWCSLNTLLNEYADKERMCGDYERQLNTWNESLSVLQLEGRHRNWTVGVVNPELWDGTAWITVNATSPAAADKIAEELSTFELLQKVIEADSVNIKKIGTVSVTETAH